MIQIYQENVWNSLKTKLAQKSRWSVASQISLTLHTIYPPTTVIISNKDLTKPYSLKTRTNTIEPLLGAVINASLPAAAAASSLPLYFAALLHLSALPLHPARPPLPFGEAILKLPEHIEKAQAQVEAWAH